MQIIESSKKYDVVIVGSGDGSGMATKVLAYSGLKVAVVEAGPYFDPANPEQQTQLKWPHESLRRGANTHVFSESLYGLWRLGARKRDLYPSWRQSIRLVSFPNVRRKNQSLGANLFTLWTTRFQRKRP